MSTDQHDRTTECTGSLLPSCPLCRRELLNNADRLLSEEEARDLCFYLDIDYDSLGGNGKRAKIRELILFLKRKGKVNDFVVLVVIERSQVIEFECSHMTAKGFSLPC